VGSVAVLRAQKALDVLIAAHARLLERVPDAHLVLAGDGDQRPGLERVAAELGLSGRVHFLGMRADVDGILRELDVAAISSDWEGTPLSAYECFASGTPLVATSVGGLPEIVEDGVGGILVPPRDPSALADAIAGLLLDPSLRSRLAAAAAARLQEFSIETVAGAFAELYAQLL
jgi:glycosyltransferase involved in cell wall biosynthesis